MIFSSLLFLFRFLPLILIAYYAAPKRLRNGILFIGSLVFYGWGEPVYISLLLFSTVVDFFHGKLVEQMREQGRLRAAKLAVVSSVVINLSLLCFFKYGDFLLEACNQVFKSEFAPMDLPLPIGISFYTFQTMSYTIDVYRGKARAQKDMVAFGAYVSLFPQLIAGPIVRYHTIADELGRRRESFDQFALGVRRFVAGLGKKVLIANNMGVIWEEVLKTQGDERSVLMVWLGIFAFGMQIYFDFSGYSDMAVGLGHMFGFHFPENFDYPYQSKSITEFWRRWHISLGTWFKEYVYIPLGGNQRGKAAQVRNILIVWLLTGIWHGAGWNFLLWGLYFGLLLLAEKLFLQKILKRLPAFLCHVYAIFLVFLGWVLFAFEDMESGLAFMKQLFFMGDIQLINGKGLYLLYTRAILIIAAVAGSTAWPSVFGKRMMGRLKDSAMVEMIYILILLAACIAYLVNASYNPFLYFRF